MAACFSCQTVQVVFIQEKQVWMTKKEWLDFPAETQKGTPFFSNYYSSSIKYPQLMGMKKRSLQDSINYQLHKLFSGQLPERKEDGKPYALRWPLEVFTDTDVGYGKTRGYSSHNRIKVFYISNKFVSMASVFVDDDDGYFGGSGSYAFWHKPYNFDLTTGKRIYYLDFFEKEYATKVHEILLKYYKNPVTEAQKKKYGTIGLQNSYFMLSKRHYIFFMHLFDYYDYDEVKIPKKVLRKYVKKQYRKL